MKGGLKPAETLSGIETAGRDNQKVKNLLKPQNRLKPSQGLKPTRFTLLTLVYVRLQTG